MLGEASIERYPGHQYTHEEPSHDHAFARDTDRQFGYLVHQTPLHGGDHDVYLGVRESHEHVPLLHHRLKEAHDTRAAVMDHHVAAHADLSVEEAAPLHGAIGHVVTHDVHPQASDFGAHYYPGRTYADEKAMIQHQFEMQ